tara:strand:+ start:428 stop:781 length:354 start_codon:yes stop_codon:yes gene_type:complete
MNNQLTLKDAQKYQNLIARQFNEIARSLVLSNDETWELFLKQKESEFLDPVHLPIIKAVLFSLPAMTIKDYRDALCAVIAQNKFCLMIPILHSMTDGVLLPELVQHHSKITAVILAT